LSVSEALVTGNDGAPIHYSKHDPADANAIAVPESYLAVFVKNKNASEALKLRSRSL